MMADEDLLEHDVVERILRRASELARTSVPSATGISEAALVAAAGEVGLSIEAVQRSIALERLGPAPTISAMDRIVGPSTVVVDESVTTGAADALSRVDAWMVGGHHLRRDRLRPGQGEWSRRRGPTGVAMRTVRHATGEGHLGHFQRVTATVRDAGDGSSVVRITVDRSHQRAVAGGGGVVVAVGGTVGVIAGAVAASPLILIAAPVALLAGLGVALTGRGRAGDVEHEVERVLDAVADRVEPVRLRSDVATRLGRRQRRRGIA